MPITVLYSNTNLQYCITPLSSTNVNPIKPTILLGLTKGNRARTAIHTIFTSRWVLVLYMPHSRLYSTVTEGALVTGSQLRLDLRLCSPSDVILLHFPAQYHSGLGSRYLPALPAVSPNESSAVFITCQATTTCPLVRANWIIFI